MTDVAAGEEFPDEVEVVQTLLSFQTGDAPVETRLRTDARVIARVTDGIYRQPGSALRELISNAYDADATRVVIKTDRPRFARIVIEDDGLGMSPEVLVRTLYHIGGSAKRTQTAVEMGISSAKDAALSPGGRELIGKIGIGLFSIAQLTQSFQIITKRGGDDFRTIASVALKQFNDLAADGDADEEYEAGKVLVWREPAQDTDSQGTTVVLDAIRPQTRDTLRSHQAWEALASQTAEATPLTRPAFHIGAVVPEAEDTLYPEAAPTLPWGVADKPAAAFEKLVLGVRDLARRGHPNVHLDRQLDYYLKMIWDLSLWVPLPYLHSNPFELESGPSMAVYPLDTGTAMPDEELASARQALRSPLKSYPSDFAVLVDDLELRRPIVFDDPIETSSALQRSLLLVGDSTEEFSGVPLELSGGVLSFRAYLHWSPKVVPAEHQGVMVRVHNAAGTYFDQDFFRFPVAEQRRMGQITCEIFVTRGFDGALNIDRESFNFSHPHTVYITKWIHAALRRTIGLQKRISSKSLAGRRAQKRTDVERRLARTVTDIWREQAPDDSSDPPMVAFGSEFDDGAELTVSPARLFERTGVPAAKDERERLIRGLLQAMAAFGLLDELTREEVEALAEAFNRVIEVAK